MRREAMRHRGLRVGQHREVAGGYLWPCCEAGVPFGSMWP